MAKLTKASSPIAPNAAADYPVGYAKPPKASQFQKGRSGNPGGASKKVRARKSDATISPFDQIILKAACHKIAINENGVRSKITTHEAIIKKLAIGAVKGEPSAIKRYLDHVQSAVERQQKETMGRFSLLVQYVTEQSVARAVSPPSDTAPVWPRPNDVVLDYASFRGEVRGPIDAGQAEPFDALVGEYRIWQARHEHLQSRANQAAGELLLLYDTAVVSVERLLGVVRFHLPSSFEAQLESLEGEIPTGALEIADPGGGTINLAILSPDGADCVYALHILSASAADIERDIPRRAKLNIAANTTSLINRLQIERQNSDGGAPPVQAVPDFDQFYDGYASEGLGGGDNAAP
ncbi:DUF5681 domain-containing protein [Novosphingobium sp.]|uniref:DUF5681 domain-containing protein n=1 Tax=Novosphingobium sp. TaxID=1874826 RepID=UPI003BAD3F6F